MENKFVTVAHLQQIPELCLLIKAAATTEEGKKHAHTHTQTNSPSLAFLFTSATTAICNNNNKQNIPNNSKFVNV